jgi:hypothetical protein
MDIRLLTPADIPHVQQANITNLPENYFCKYYLYHALSWPQLSYVAVDVSVSFCFFWSFFRPDECMYGTRRMKMGSGDRVKSLGCVIAE